MATVTTWAGAPPSSNAAPPKARKTKDEHRALSYSMDRVLTELQNLRETARDSAVSDDVIHDLRVSIRRCRSVAEVLEEVDPDPAWQEMRQAAKKLFHGLGALRDAHVLQSWVQKLAPAEDPIAAQLLADFSAREPELRQEALRAARKFDEKKWKHLERELRQRSRLVPLGSLAAECLALERFEAARELHSRALRTEKPKPWHALRKSMKQFRYTVENLLPEHHASWRENLKRVQDLLGDVHDFDVLAEYVEAVCIDEASAHDVSSETVAAARRAWRELLTRERAERIATYRQLMLGSTSLWTAWRHALPHGERLQAAALARLRATARASDAHPQRTARTARLAKSLFDSLRRAKAATTFGDPRARQLLAAAANLQNVRPGNSDKSERPKSQQKIAHNFLRKLAKPPGFATDDWNLLLATVRYHRGPEPHEKSSVFANLSHHQQNAVRALAGVLRLARALRKSGAEATPRFRAESTPEAIIVRIPSLSDSIEAASRLATAKHLLEVHLAKPLVLRPLVEQQIPAIADSTPSKSELPHFAAASD
ncbi:MAG TPA: CHAD domain-containing protein [Candidatus Acidoferrum sp.]|nr:CHAD domain-containing protein [Candidatus Acidoferrum sp.]